MVEWSNQKFVGPGLQVYGLATPLHFIAQVQDLNLPHILRIVRMTSIHWPHQHFELLSFLVHPNNAHFITCRQEQTVKADQNENLQTRSYRSMGWLRPCLKVTVTVEEAVSRFSSLAHFVDNNYASLFAMELKKLLINSKIVAFQITWDQAQFSFRFVNKPLAVAVRDNVWEPLKLGLTSGYFSNEKVS